MSTNGNHDERALREALANALESVGQDVAEPIAALKRRARTMKFVIWGLVWLKILTTTTLIMLFVSLNNTKANQREIEELQKRTNNEVLCPLYDLFERSAKLPPPPHYSAEQQRERLVMFEEIAKGADKLNCKK